MARRSALGKGLDALIPSGDAEAGGGNGSLAEIAIQKIRPNPYQPRQTFEDEAIDDLADSITALGLLQPLLVRRVPDGYELVAGERRLRAARKAGLATVPALVRDLADQESLEQAVVENVQREDLLPLEEAAAYKQLMDEFSLSQEEVARRVGRSRPAVANSVRLLSLPVEIQQLLQERQLDAGHARALLSLDDQAAQVSIGKAAAKQGWSVRQVETRVRDELEKAGPDAGTEGGAPEAPRPDTRPRPAGVLEVEGRLSDFLQTRVAVTATASGRGRVTIEFAGLEDLDRIFSQILGSETQ